MVWIGDFRLQSTLILPADVPELRMQLPDADFSIQNASKDDLPNEALAAQIVDEIQARTPAFEFGDAIGVMWQVATAAIFNSLQIKGIDYESMTFGKPDRIVSRNISFKALMQIGMYGDPNNPQLRRPNDNGHTCKCSRAGD